MPFVKVVKNRAYFRRYQTKFRRRREGKTDYFARKRLVVQDKNKYNSPKYRLVVRRSNRDVTVQVTCARLAGDEVVAAAYSHELPRFGLKVGLTNYAAHYATGLLAARRLLKKFKLDTAYQGNTENLGEDYHVEEGDGPRPFKALLDVGLARTTTGARIFAAMKGAADGGVNVPHNEKRLVGYDSESKELSADDLRAHIFGSHVAEYMKTMKEEDEEKFKAHFSRYIKEGVTPDNLEASIKACHDKIRANPDPQPKKEHKKPEKPLQVRKSKRNNAQRKDRIKQILASRGTTSGEASEGA